MTTRRSTRRAARRRNPGTITRTKLFGNSPIPFGGCGDVARSLVGPERYAFKPHRDKYLLVKFASAEALRHEMDEDGYRAPAFMGGGSRGMGKAAIGWSPAVKWLNAFKSNPSGKRRKNPARSRSTSGKLYRMSDGSVLTAAQYKRIWPGGKCPSPAARRLLGITVLSGKRANPCRRRRNAPLTAAQARALRGVLKAHAKRTNPGTIMLRPALVRRLFEWHGGQSSHLYYVASNASARRGVSVDEIESALGELRRAMDQTTQASAKNHAKDTIAQLERAVGRHCRTNPTWAKYRAKAKTAAGKRAATHRAKYLYSDAPGVSDRSWHLSRIAHRAGGLNKFHVLRLSRGKAMVKRTKRRTNPEFGAPSGPFWRNF